MLKFSKEKLQAHTGIKFVDHWMNECDGEPVATKPKLFCKGYEVLREWCTETNFDRITSSPEALAGTIHENLDRPQKCLYCAHKFGYCGDKDCVEGVVNWLNQLVDDD